MSNSRAGDIMRMTIRLFAFAAVCTVPFVSPLHAGDNEPDPDRVVRASDLRILSIRDPGDAYALIPGVVSLGKDVFFRGSRPDQVGYTLSSGWFGRYSITDIVHGGPSVTIPLDLISRIRTDDDLSREHAGSFDHFFPPTFDGDDNLHLAVSYRSDNIAASSSSAAFDGGERLGSHWFGYSDLSVVGGGTIAEGWNLSALAHRVFRRDNDPRQYPGIALGRIGDGVSEDTVDATYPAGAVRGNSDEYTTFGGVIRGRIADGVTLEGIAIATRGSSRAASNNEGSIGVLSNMLNEGRTPRTDYANGLIGISLGHSVSPRLCYQVSAAYSFKSSTTYDPMLGDNILGYGDSVANAAAGVVWHRRRGSSSGRFIMPDRYDVFTFHFRAPGDVVADYGNDRNRSLSLQAGINALIGHHDISLEAEYRTYTVRHYLAGNPALRSLAGVIYDNSTLPSNLQRPRESILNTWGIDYVGFDPLGREIDDDTYAGPRKPVFAHASLRDDAWFGETNIDLSLRLDHIDTDNYTLLDPMRPHLAFDMRNATVLGAGLRKVSDFTAASPRIRVTQALSQELAVTASLGRFIEQPALAPAYHGLARTFKEYLIDGFVPQPGGMDLRPVRTLEAELGCSCVVPGIAGVGVRTYYRAIHDQVTVVVTDPGQTSQFGPYFSLQNGDESRVAGVEVVAAMERHGRFRARGAFSVMNARGTGSDPYGNLGYIIDWRTGYAGEPWDMFPLDYNETFRGNVLLDYRFGRDDGGPLLERLGANVLLAFNSGHPYTRYTGEANVEGEIRQRFPVDGRNQSTTPWVMQVDLVIDKTLDLPGGVAANLFLQVINLFGARNVQNVFWRTGSPTDDDYLANPALGAQLVQFYGQQYADLYKAVNIDYYQQYQQAPWPYSTPAMFGPPRQVRFGIRLEM